MAKKGRPTKTQSILNSMKQGPINPISNEMTLPNNSGDHQRSIKRNTPIGNQDLVNKEYVDSEIVDKAWLKATNQTGLTGDKSGSFDINTTGTGRFDGNLLDDSDVRSIDLVNRKLCYDDSTCAVEWGVSKLVDTSDDDAVDWNSRILLASGGTDTILDWDTAGLADFKDSDVTTTGEVSTPQVNITGGTANMLIYEDDDNFYLENPNNEKNLIFRMKDGGSSINALRFFANDSIMQLERASASAGPKIRFRNSSGTQWELQGGNTNFQIRSGTTVIMEIDRSGTDGLFSFLGDTSGFPYGNFWGNDIAETILGTEFSAPVIVSDSDITAGELNDATFQNNQELVIGKPGRYLINYSVSVKAGVTQHIVAGIGVNGTRQNCGQTHGVMPAGNAEQSLSSTAILDLASTNTITIMLDNESGSASPANDVDVEHVSLSITHIGGT
ncbi:hypothetical protein CMI37_27320 [Candidatus Pacearchaeota archaeon]|nr:hypothetical protein [Candidatus Pacearchaeota archaeon]|tara:strand:- start:2717 stop:4045 length:1329 start_codon:yes stop_codon:yes gene_type:complete